MTKNENLHPKFNGFWMPREIWEDMDLSLIEKCFYCEIVIFDNLDKCNASNNFFSKFFNLSPNRCSAIIASLIKKRYIKAEYITENKTVVERILRPKKIDYRYSENDCAYSENDNRGIPKTIKGYSENDKYIDNNIKDNREIDNSEKDSDLSFVSKSNRESVFKRPTVDDIRLYMRELSIYSDAEPDRFFDYYESNGWMVGKHKMRDWKAAVRNWKRNLEKYGKTDPTRQPTETPKAQELTPAEKLELRRKQIKESEAKNG